MKNPLLALLFSCFLFHMQTTHAQQQVLITPAIMCHQSLGTFQIPEPENPYGKPVAYYTFLFNDGFFIQTNAPSMIRQVDGGYWSVSAKVHFSDSSILAIDSTSFTVYHNPIPGFTLITPRILCLGETTCFKNLATQNPLQPSNPIYAQVWVFGNGFFDSSYTDSGTNVCHRHSFSGAFATDQKVIDTKGCASYSFTNRNFDSVLIVTSPIPVKFTWTGTAQCFGSTYTFINKSIYDNNKGKPKKYIWDFGDSSTFSATAPFSTQQLQMLDSITHTYTRTGIFSPKLTLIDSIGCSYSTEYNQQNTPLPLPQNTTIDSTIIISEQANLLSHSTLFCSGTGPKQIYFSHSPIPIAQPGANDFIWNFDDPISMQLNSNNSTFQPAHAYTLPGTYIVSFTTQNLHPSCNITITDTITIKGPLARIEHIPANSYIAPQQKYQISSSDTVDFVNNTMAFQNSKLHFTWDFNDEYAPLCTAYSIPNSGFSEPFFDAKQQYENSTHYYRLGGNTYAGKMNCRWSLDSLPRHLYTNWDTIYQWHLNGKTFPANWGLPSISNNAPITIPSTGIPDPFLQAIGIIANIPAGYSINGPSDMLTYTIPDKGTYSHSGMQLLPNSSMTFHGYIFLYSKVHGYHVKLVVNDSLNITSNCSSSDSVVISHGKPDARGMGIAGKICPGAWPNGVQFQFGPTQNSSGIKPEFGRTVLLINFDSLADRKDNTPCNLDGFIGYNGGTTNGGLQFPPFSSKPNFNPIPWTDAAQNNLYYHYGPNAPFGRRGPADTVTGYITIGVIVGTGCANPPECDQAIQYSDTIWYHNLFKLEQIKAAFTTEQQDDLKTKHKIYTYTPAQSILGNVKYDAWSWDDETYTVDSFWYASSPITDNFYVNGFRRVRYHYTERSGVFAIKDSIVFPLGIPRTLGRYYIDTLSREKPCGQPDSSYVTLLKDSALMLLPMTHRFVMSSFEKSSNKSNPSINSVIRTLGNLNGCTQSYNILQTVGIINTFETQNQHEIDSVFCLGEELSCKSFIRYFRYDNQHTQVPFNPGRSYNQVYEPPYDTLNYDTINFWQKDIAQPGDIESIKLNPFTNIFDTIYYEKTYWDFGDGSPLIKGMNATHQYTIGGEHIIKMITRDSTGNYDTAYKNMYVSVPKAHIGFPTDQFGKPITIIPCGGKASFVDSSYIVNVANGFDVIDYNFWRFGELSDSLAVNSINNLNPTRTYRNNGSFNVKLKVITRNGCQDEDIATIFVNGPRPAFKFLSSSNVCGLTVKIIDQTDVLRPLQPANPNDTPSVSVMYYWGDGTTTLLSHKLDTLTHTYATNGIYKIKAVASDAPVGSLNTCAMVTYPDTTLGYEHVFVNVIVLEFDSISGKSDIRQYDDVVYQIPETPFADYNWTVTGGTLLSGNHTHSIKAQWINQGIFSVTVTKSLHGCSHTETLAVSVLPPTGLNKVHSENNFELYPNPSKGIVNTDLFASETKEITVNIYDILGKSCLTDRYTAATGNNNKTYNVQKFKPGIYFIEVNTGNEKLVQKLIIE